MSSLLVIRHAATAWSQTHRLQGRADLPLSPEGRAAALAWRLPAGTRRIQWWTSPLRRALETAAQLGVSVTVEPALIEMDWGAWEGATIAALRAAGTLTAAIEARGLDLRPPGGESPREVQARLRPWLKSLVSRPEAQGAITHKGVIRALYALATGWDMAADPPTKLRDAHAHRFTLDSSGRVGVDQCNISLSTINL